MIELRDIGLHRGGRPVFEGLTLAIHAGWRVGVVGANGSGKTTLLELIRGRLTPDAGEVGVARGLAVAAVEQHSPGGSRPAIDQVLDGDPALRATERALVEAEAEGDGARIGTLHERMRAIDGYAARARAAALMHGLGFAPADLERPVEAFSGGWRRRLALARALMSPADLLVLDEPTNHLDLDAVLWLEGHLASRAGTLLVVSHDREFLDAVVDRVVHLRERAAALYPGHYSAFETARSAELVRRRTEWARQQAAVTRIQRFVARNRVRTAGARQAQSRLKALERMQAVAPAHADSPVEFRFAAPGRLARPLVRLEAACAGYGACTVLSDLHLAVGPGDRMGLLGPNGAGKSTLARLLAGEMTPLSGRREAAGGLVVGHFAQHVVEGLDPSASPLEHLRRIDRDAPEQRLRDFLGGFGFGGDRALEPVAPLSGGEKARAALAVVVYRRPGLLVLDEPTNHLDLQMRHALEVALQEFDGALVLVTHDRHLARSVVDRFWLVSGGAVRAWDGDLDDYAAWMGDRGRATPAAAGTDTVDPRRARRRDTAQQRSATAPLRAEVRRLEAEITRLEAERDRIDAALADPDLYADEAASKSRVPDLKRARARLARTLADAEARWLDAAEALDASARGPGHAGPAL